MRLLQQWTFDNPSCQVFTENSDTDTQPLHIEFRIPYLNSYPKHQDYQILRLVADGEYVYRIRLRVGKGWSARFVSLRAFEATKAKIESVLKTGSLLLVTICSCIVFVIGMINVLGPESSILASNLSPEGIIAKIQECEQNQPNICAEYSETLYELKELDFVSRLIYPLNQSITEVFGTYGIILYIWMIVYVMSAIFILAGGRIAQWISNKYYGVQARSKFELM